MKKQNKRHFQLLEVMIACFLVAACAIPVMTTFVNVYMHQKELNQTFTVDHLAHLAHARIIENLYSRGAKGESVQDILNTTFYVSDLNQNPLSKSPYDFKYSFTIDSPKKVSTQETAEKLLLSLSIQAFKKKDPNKTPFRKYSYLTFVTRPVKLGANPNDQQNTSQNDATQDKVNAPPAATGTNKRKPPGRKKQVMTNAI